MENYDAVAEEFETHILNFLVCTKTFNLGSFTMENLTVEKRHSVFKHELLYTMRTLIPAENMKEETHSLIVEYPCDWKQALKKRFFPMWLKKRCPVKYMKIEKKVKFVAYNLYPEFPTFKPYECRNAVQHIVKTLKSSKGKKENARDLIHFKKEEV